MTRPNPLQILQAARNTRLSAMTHGSRLYAALQHVMYSRIEKPAGAGGSLNVLADTITGVTHEF